MGRSGSIKLATVFGIRIGVSVSWFVILFLYIFVLSRWFRTALGGSDGVAYATAVASAALLFASVVLHELGHALMARRLGIEIAGIDLWFFGGLARMRREPDTPGAELKVALAGPAVTLAILVVCVAIGLGVAGPGPLRDAALFGGGVGPGLLLLGWVAWINAVLLVFNLVPAFPLDGGRVARAVVWRISGSRATGTRASARLGLGFAYLLGAGGLVLVALAGNLYGLYLLFVAFFIGSSARAEVARSAFNDRLGGVRVADIMDREPVTIPAELPVERALDEFFLRYGWSWFAVVDREARFVGLVRQEPVEAAVTHGVDRHATVADVMELDDGERRVGAQEPLSSVLGSEALGRLGALMAVDGGGVLRGVVTVEQVRRALQSAVAAPGAAAGSGGTPSD